jgi:hypothetical protein
VSKSSDGKVFYYKYELPFAFRPDQVLRLLHSRFLPLCHSPERLLQLSAEYTADQRLLVKLKKPASSGSSSETTISQFALSPASGISTSFFLSFYVYLYSICALSFIIFSS